MKKIFLTMLIMIFILNTTTVFGFDYGDKSGLTGLEQFAGQNYVIYKNADTNRIELAVVTADDINNRSLIAEIDGQVEVSGDKEVKVRNTIDGINYYSRGNGEDIPPLGNKRLYITETENPYYTVKSYYDNGQWINLEGLTANQDICANYEELIYSSFPVIEKINKEKVSRPYYRAYSGEYYIDMDKVDTQDQKRRYYIRFSKDGINFDKIVEVILKNNGDIGGAYSGNGITIVMGTANMALSDFQRPAGFSNGCIYVFDENCDLVDTVDANGLMRCYGFYNGYFYFATKIYTAKGEYTEKYFKSTDGINYTEVIRDEAQEALDYRKKTIYKTAKGDSVSFENESNEKTRVFLTTGQYENEIEVIYENDYKIEHSDIVISTDLSGYVVRSKYRTNKLGDNQEYVTSDYIYKIYMPPIDKTKYIYPNDKCIWATDDYIYIDQDVEYVFRIPMYQFDDLTYVQLNDKILGFDQPPVMEDDRTLVPMRFLFEQMGAEVTWDETNQAATATINMSALGAGASATGRATLSNSDISFPNLAKTEKSVTFSVDNTTATVNGTTATMDVPARLINDQTFVPLRFLSENLGYTVDWDEATNTAIITTE